MTPATGVERGGLSILPEISIERVYRGVLIKASLEPYPVSMGGFDMVFWEYGQREPFSGAYETHNNGLYGSLFRIDKQTTYSPYATAVYITPDVATPRGGKMAWSNKTTGRWGLKLTGMGETVVQVMDFTNFEVMNEVPREGFVEKPFILSEESDGELAIREIPIGDEVIIEGTRLAVLPVLVKDGWSGGVLVAPLDLVTSQALVSGRSLAKYLSGELSIEP